MRTLAEIATDHDTVELIMKQMGLADGLRLARTSKVWRDASRGVCGIARTLIATTERFVYPGNSIQYGGRNRYYEDRFVSPACTTILPSGDICVVDSSHRPRMRRAQIYSADLKFKHEIVCPAPLLYSENSDCYAEGHFTAAAASAEHLFLTYYAMGASTGAIYKYRLSDFELLATFEGTQYEERDGEAEDEDDDDDIEWTSYFCMPIAVVVVGRRLFVCDHGGECGYSSVVVFDLDLKHLLTFGKEGEGALCCPEGIAAHDGLIYVADQFNDRVAVFDEEGVFQREVLCNGERMGCPLSVAIARGRLLVGCTYSSAGSTKSNDGVVFVLTPDGDLLQKIKFALPISLCVHDSKDRVYVSDFVDTSGRPEAGNDIKILSFNSEPMRPPPRDIGPVTKLVGMGWAAVRALSISRSE